MMRHRSPDKTGSAVRLLPICALLLFAAGCTERNYAPAECCVTDRTETIRIDVSRSDRLMLLDIVKSCTFIPLETTDESLIGSIDIIGYKDSLFYIADRRQKKQLFVFGADGTFSHTIGRCGRGPDEYIEPSDFCLTDSAVVVLDMYSRSLKYYKPEGDVIRSHKMDFVIYEIASRPSDAVIYAKAGDNSALKQLAGYELLTLTEEGELKAKSCKNPYSMNYTPGYDLHCFNGGIVYCRALRPAVIGLKGDSMQTRYILDITPMPLPADFEKQCRGSFERFTDKFGHTHAWFNGHYWETDSYAAIGTTYRNRPYMTVYDKSAKTSRTGIIGTRYDAGSIDYNGLICKALNRAAVCNEGNTLTGYIFAHELPEELRSEFFGSASDIADKNPLLMKIILK